MNSSPDRRCPASGCQWEGTISLSASGGGPWFCRAHFQRSEEPVQGSILGPTTFDGNLPYSDKDEQ